MVNLKLNKRFVVARSDFCDEATQLDCIGRLLRQNTARNDGFTLIEILVVICIISIVTGVALLSIGHNENKKLTMFTDELMQTLSLAEERAMLQPAVLGLSLKQQTIQFSAYHPHANDKMKAWAPLEDNFLTKRQIPDDIQIGVEMGGTRITDINHQLANTLPQIIISTNGDLTPFTLYIGKRGKKPRYVIHGEADGNMSSKLLG